jgi:hypothetical protein
MSDTTALLGPDPSPARGGSPQSKAPMQGDAAPLEGDTPERLSSPLHLQAIGRREYRARFVSAGQIRQADNTPGPYIIPPEAIQQAIHEGRFDARSTFIDHAGWFDGPSLRNLAGITLDAAWDDTAQAATGTIRLYQNAAGAIIADLFDAILQDQAAGEPIPDVGLSLVFWPRWKPRDNYDEPRVVAEFRHIESVDFVFQPAAEGRVTDALEALSAISARGGEHSAALGPPAAPAGLQPGPNIPAIPEQESSPERSPTVTEPQPTYDTTTPEPDPGNVLTPTEQAQAQLDEETRRWAAAVRRSAVDAVLQASGLPPAAVDRLRNASYPTVQDLDNAIDAERQYLASLTEDHVVQIGDIPPRQAHRITMGRTGLEQLQAALDAMLDGIPPPAGVAPLSGIREFYHLLSGDWEMHGIYQPDRVYLANVTSSTMAGLVANALNKRVAIVFAQYPMWWRPIVTEEDFSNLQDVRWITLGGVGEIPTVAEGAAYTELTWDDKTETEAFVKKGGYLGLTIEAIDKDDTRKIRAAPQALAQAAWLTLSKDVSAIFTSNSGAGPTLADTYALFEVAHHANLLTTALSWTAFTAVRTAMRKQTELNSGERLGALTAPRYLLVPPDLEMTALQIMASEGEPGTGDNDENPLAEGNVHDARMQAARRRVIVVDLWTDATDWAAVADPLLYPSIGIGYRYGRQPEIFSVASPTAGLMFTNDTLPIKVRFFYAVGPIDYRGLHKSNVAG